jgi:hypothetical protein
MLEDNRKRENNSNTMDAGNKHFIEQNIYKSIKFPEQASTKDTKVYYINSNNKNYGRRLKSLRHLSSRLRGSRRRRSIRGAGRSHRRPRHGSQGRCRRRNQRYNLGCILLRPMEEFLHLREGTSMGRTNLLPIHFFAMRLGQGNRPFNASFHRRTLKHKDRVIGGLESFE